LIQKNSVHFEWMKDVLIFMYISSIQSNANVYPTDHFILVLARSCQVLSAKVPECQGHMIYTQERKSNRRECDTGNISKTTDIRVKVMYRKPVIKQLIRKPVNKIFSEI